MAAGGAYERLSSEAGRRREGAPAGACAGAGAWAALRRAAAGLARLYAARRRWAARRLAWEAGQGIKAPAPAPAARYGYDAASYARNFDDGEWKADEGVLWSAGRTSSLAACRLARAVSTV